MKKIVSLFLMLMLLIGAASAEALFTPGTYDGVSNGFHGPIHVQVEVSEDAIVSVKVGENHETNRVGTLAFPILEENIVANQSLADVVTGATISSRGTTNAVVNALEAAGATAETISALKAAPLSIENPGDTETDIVVVGAGAAGMMAAMQAKDLGANVILLEKNSITGGSARVAAGSFIAYGAPEYGDATFKAEELHRWYSIKAGPVYNDDVFYTILNNGKTMLAYLQENGYQNAMLTTSQAKLAPVFNAIIHENFGTEIVKVQTEALEKKGVDLRYNSTVTELIQEADGSISGVVVDCGAGTYTIKAKKVILATGGFTHNNELMAKYSNGWENEFRITASGATGDGHRMGVAAGGQLVGDGVLQMHATNYNPSLEANQPGNAPLFVDSKGEQMCAMDEHYTTITDKIHALEDRTAWAIYSSDNVYITFRYEEDGLFDVADMEALAANGTLVKADTIEELAEKIGADPATLKRNVDQHNWYYDYQINDAWGTAAAALQPLKTGPFYAGRQVASVMGTITGLVIDTDMQVLNTDGATIPNLYAIGELIFGNIFNGNYPASGTAIGICLNTGMLAAQHAVGAMK